MDAKKTGIVFISILFSAILGLGSSFYLLNPRINNLETNFNAFEEDINNKLNDLTSNLSNIRLQIEQLNTKFDNLENNYNELNSKINSIKSEVNVLDIEIYEVKTNINQVNNMKFHKAFFIQGQSDIRSDEFEIKGKNIRFVIDAEGEDATAWLDIIIRFNNGTFYSRRTVSGIYNTLSTDMEVVERGYFYIEVNVYKITTFSITIWDYY